MAEIKSNKENPISSITQRKLQEISGSLLLTVPKTWANSFNLSKGSVVNISTIDNGVLLISPKPTKIKQKKSAMIEYSKYFVRDFLRQYFLGNEKITINLKINNNKNHNNNKRNYNNNNNNKSKKNSNQHKKEIYFIIKKFMNAQIIEETEDKIVVKCFKIEELSIRECLNRMYFLSLNSIDNLLGEGDKVLLEETKKHLGRFYYMLVMQVRRFIDEGKFTEQNQISLLYALDCRMVAEKIKWINDLCQTLTNVNDSKIKSLMLEIKRLYSKSYQCFFNHKYEKAIRLIDEENEIRIKLDKLHSNYSRKKEIATITQINGLKLMTRYFKSIAMLTR
jgi:phosphate uptake regulator